MVTGNQNHLITPFLIHILVDMMTYYFCMFKINQIIVCWLFWRRRKFSSFLRWCAETVFNLIFITLLVLWSNAMYITLMSYYLSFNNLFKMCFFKLRFSWCWFYSWCNFLFETHCAMFNCKTYCSKCRCSF